MKRRSLIIGLLIAIGFTVQAPDANALYSPTIAQRATQIRQHILTSQARNGTGDVLEVIGKIKAYNKRKRSEGKESGVAAEAKAAQSLVQQTNFTHILTYPLEPIMMVFNINIANGPNSAPELISNCLRDDIWQLEALRDTVAAEMIKAYFNFDGVNGKILENDYKYLVNQLALLRQYGAHPESQIQVNVGGGTNNLTSNEYFFQNEPGTPETENYYVQKYFHSDDTGCPDGEFEEVFQKVVNSWETLKVLGSGQGTDFNFNNIKAMAEANAKLRARQWIKANQITLTLGGESGARTTSLFNANGWDRLVGNVKTQLNIVRNMVGPVTPLFSKEKWRTHAGNQARCAYYKPEEKVFRDCDNELWEQFRECKKDEEAAEDNGIKCNRFKDLEEVRSLTQVQADQIRAAEENEEEIQEAEQALVYGISLDSVSEQSIIALDGILGQINGEIQGTYEGLGTKGGEALPTLLKHVEIFKKQCVNKSS